MAEKKLQSFVVSGNKDKGDHEKSQARIKVLEQELEAARKASSASLSGRSDDLIPVPSRLEVLKNAFDLRFRRVVRAETLPASVLLTRERVVRRLNECGQKKLATMFEKTYTNTLETTVGYVNDGSVFVITGDIDHMWLRDSAAQVSHYLDGGLARKDVHVQLLMEGVIKRQMHFISKVRVFCVSVFCSLCLSHDSP